MNQIISTIAIVAMVLTGCVGIDESDTINLHDGTECVRCVSCDMSHQGGDPQAVYLCDGSYYSECHVQPDGQYLCLLRKEQCKPQPELQPGLDPGIEKDAQTCWEFASAGGVDAHRGYGSDCFQYQGVTICQHGMGELPPPGLEGTPISIGDSDDSSVGPRGICWLCHSMGALCSYDGTSCIWPQRKVNQK